MKREMWDERRAARIGGFIVAGVGVFKNPPQPGGPLLAWAFALVVTFLIGMFIGWIIAALRNRWVKWRAQ